MINATKMGQLGTEYLDDRRQEFQILEKIVKRDLINRKKDLAQVQQNVENFADNLKNLLRRDSDINLGRVKLQLSESYILLNRDIETIEQTLNMLKNSIFTQTIETIYPCIKEQLRQKERLTSLVDKCEKSRDDLLKKDNHAQMMQSVLENTMIETTAQYNSKKQELLSDIEEEERKIEDTQELITNRYNLLAKVRVSLRHLQYISRLLNTNKKSITIMFKKADDAANYTYKPEEDEVDAIKILPDLTAKFTKLAAGAKEILTGATMEEGYRMFESLMRERCNSVQVDIKISEESLIETVFADAHVLTRDDIKKQSDEIVAANQVTDDVKPVASSKKKKFKFKK